MDSEGERTMRKVHMRPTHYTFHREGPAPCFRLQADEASPQVRVEFAARAQLFVAANQGERTPDTYFDSATGNSEVAGQQLQLSQHKLTYDLPNAVWQRLKANNHLYYRATATTQMPPDWNAPAPRTVRTVDDGYAARGIAHYFGVPHDRLYDPWTFPDQGPLNQVPQYYRAKLTLLTRYPEGHEDAYLLRQLAGHENYTALPEDQRTKALLVFAATDRPARRAMLQLFSRIIEPTTAGGARVPAVRNTDLSAQHATLLDNLARLVNVDPHMDIPETMDTLVADVIEEVADPFFQINQGTKGTCVPTSVQWITVTYFPAEYTRLMLGLLTQSGSATLANSDQVMVPTDTYRYDPQEDSPAVARFVRRSWSERLFQATMMNYSRPGMTYSNLLDVFTDKRGGLTMDELLRLLRGLRNRQHQRLQGAGADLVSNLGQRLQSPNLPVLTMMCWGAPPNQGFHEVVGVRADATAVTFRNPWGGMNYRVGDMQPTPPRTCTNPSRAEETMIRTDLSAWIDSLVVEV
jgi:hypothetical protein